MHQAKGKMSKEIVLCFLPLDSELLERSMLNWAAGKIAPRRLYAVAKSKPMVHVELWLKGDNDSGFAASICYNRTAHYTKKSFSRKSWNFRSLYVSEQQFKKLQLFLSAQKGAPFNRMGFYLLGLGMRISGQWAERFGWRRRYFCAELIIAALKAADCLPKTNSIATVAHPEELYQYTSLISTPTTIREYSKDKVRY